MRQSQRIESQEALFFTVKALSRPGTVNVRIINIKQAFKDNFDVSLKVGQVMDLSTQLAFRVARPQGYPQVEVVHVTINQESDRLTRIVEDLVQMSQFEAGLIGMERAPSILSAVVAQLKAQLKTAAGNHELKIDIPRNLPTVDIDEMRIGQVITNLVSNAVSYSDNGTHIVLKAQKVDNEIVVSVTDQGIGIPVEHIDKVFERFYRMESGVARRRGGTSLELSICKVIVEAHGGNIWVESKPSGGSKFSFSLPIAE